MSVMEKLLILDGNSIVNRAFYGIKLLTNSEGLYTNAIYGFLSILFKYIDEVSPERICIAFDVSAPTFRHEMYDGYKAQRKGMPDELRQQMPILKEVLAAMNISTLMLAGYEADDIIGTVSHDCEARDIECNILTGDKDDLQLASDKTVIKLIITKQGSTITTDYNAEAVAEKYGVTPQQYLDVKGLMGDPSDNIPGVMGIGEKTAFDLVRRFGGIDEIYGNLDCIDIKDGVRKKLKEGRDMAYLSRQLSKIDKHVPIEYNIDDFGIKEYDSQRLHELFVRLGFSQFLKKLDLNNTAQVEKLDFTDGFFDNIKSAKAMFYHIIGDKIAVATDETDATIYTLADAAVFLQDSDITKIGFNAKEDIVSLSKQNIRLNNLTFDVMIAAYIADCAKNSYQIDSLALEYLQFDTADDDKRRLVAIMRLQKIFEKIIAERQQQALFYEVEMPLVYVLADMQILGVEVDAKRLGHFGEMLDWNINELTKRIYACADCEFNINSPKQLGEVLFEKLHLPVIKKTKTGYATNAEVLEKLSGSHEIIDCITEYRHIAKLKSTYVDGLLSVIDGQTGRVHSSFNQTVTVTGRISSSEPNMQNIPVRTELGREMRKMFRAKEGYTLIGADYSQIELRILAHIAKDESMIDAFANNIDIHTRTASQVFGVAEADVTSTLRGRAKAVNFGIVYGMGDYSLSQDLKITRREAKEYIDSYLKNFSGVSEYMTDIVQRAKADGYVTTILNRRRYLPELASSNFMTRAFGERVALNTPIQGSAADIIKIAMVKTYNALKEKNLKSKLILQVHDELIVEAHDGETEQVREILEHEMENAVALTVPLTVDIGTGKTWYETK